MKKENLFYFLVLGFLLFIGSCKKDEVIKADKSKTFQAILDQYVEYGLTGISVSISSPGQVPFNGAAGYADIDNKIPMTTSHVFSAASIPKSFTAIVILNLIDEGKLDLDSKISDYLDEEIKSMVINTDKITIRQLLNHTSGLPDVINDEYIADLNADPGRYFTLKELLNYINGKEAIAEPGKVYSYTDTNYILLYLIIEKITGNPQDALKNQIMQPLLLSNTYYGNEINYSTVPNLVRFYWKDSTDAATDFSDLENLITSYIKGAGGMATTPKDLHGFINGVFDCKITSYNNLDKILSDTVSNPNWQMSMNTAYSLGFMVKTDESGTWYGHAGNDPASASFMFYNPKTKTTIVAMTNTGTFFSMDYTILFFWNLWNELCAEASM